jgi:predicted GNAT family acetyltransferase
MNMDWIYEQGRISRVDENGELIAEATYHEKENGVDVIDHTYVLPRLRGQGIAGRMMAAVAEVIREKGGKVTASCSYASAWLIKHEKEYADIISKEIASDVLACRLNGRN